MRLRESRIRLLFFLVLFQQEAKEFIFIDRYFFTLLAESTLEQLIDALSKPKYSLRPHLIN